MKDSNFKNKKNSILDRTRNFMSRVSNSYVLKASSPIDLPKLGMPEELDDFREFLIPEEIAQIENFGLAKPDVAKFLIDKALKAKSLSKIKIDLESQEFKDEINKRAFIKNIKQKVSFVIGSIPMFKILQEISIITAKNPKATIPISFPLYFGVSLPAFVTLHIVEHTLPIGMPRTIVKCSKVLVGMPFCIISDIVDKTSGQFLKRMNLPDITLDMQGTIGVPSDIEVKDVLSDMLRWNENNPETVEAMTQLYQLQRKKK